MSYSIENCVKGSVLAGKFIDNLKYGDSLEIMVVGDSNCHYGEPATQGNIDFGARVFGLADAISKVLIDQGYNLYATPLYPVGIGSNTFKSGLGSNVGTGDNRATAPTVGAGTIRLNRDTNTLAGYLGSSYDFTNAAFSGLGEDFTFFYNEMSKDRLATSIGSLKQGFYSHDPSSVAQPASTNWFMMTASNTSAQTGRFDKLMLDGDPWLSASKLDNNTLYFRLTHSSTPNGGSINLALTRNIGGGLTNAGAANLTFAAKNTGETGARFKDSELAINTLSVAGTPVTSSNLVKSDGINIFFNGGVNGSLTAPIGLFFMSVYEKKPGFSVNLLQCEGQALPEDHFNKFKDVIDNGNYIKQFFKAAIRRQNAANPKASGKVLIVFQAGTNTNVNQGNYNASTNSTNATKRVKDSFENSIIMLKKEWVNCGFAPSDLAFVVVGGPITSNTFSDDISRLLFDGSGDNTITAVDHAKSLPRSDYVTGQYWDGSGTTGAGSSTPTTHLAEPGYIEWARSIILNILNYSRRTYKQKRG